MATTTPVGYNPSQSPISGTTQIGDLAVGTSPQQYSSKPGGITYWMGPDEQLGYVIAKPVPSGTQPYPIATGETAAYVGFSRSDLLTEASFVNLANQIAAGATSWGPTGGTAAKAWLNANGYWTSYQDTWTYDSGTNLTWPASSTGYTLYTGGFNGPDDGNSNVAIVSIDNFEMNNQGPTNQIYISTNGYITLGSGSGQIITSPQQQASPAAIAGNPADNWMQPGVTLTDGDVQNAYYLTGGVSGKSYIKFLIYGGTYGNITRPTSWLLNLYVDGVYQWVETRVKSNVQGNAGPYNAVDVSQIASTTSRVWRGDLNGQNWVYLGTGRII